MSRYEQFSAVIEAWKRRDIEADAARFHRLGRAFGHQRDDGGAVHPAREECAERNVRDQASAMTE